MTGSKMLTKPIIRCGPCTFRNHANCEDPREAEGETEDGGMKWSYGVVVDNGLDSTSLE